MCFSRLRIQFRFVLSILVTYGLMSVFLNQSFFFYESWSSDRASITVNTVGKSAQSTQEIISSIVVVQQNNSMISNMSSTIKQEKYGFVDLMELRRKYVNKVCCDLYPTKGQNIKDTNMYWLRSENIAFCPIYKSAVSTWLHHLSSLLNQAKEKEEQKKLDPTRPKVTFEQLGGSKPKYHEFMSYVNQLPPLHTLTGFMVVRHPFERLVSAYRDKLERNNLEEPFYYEKYGKHFVKKYRKEAIKVLGDEYFSEQYNFGTPIKVPDNRRPNADLPTFWEFAQAVIDNFKIDEHWEPINRFCSICSPTTMKAFRYFLKFEELETEENMFLDHLDWKIDKTQKIKLNINHPMDIKGDQLTKLYFSLLSKKQIQDLYKFYELDFLLFEYTFTINDLHFPRYM